MKAKKQGPCAKNMHHVWLPKKKDFAEGLQSAEQTCKFCEEKRTVQLVVNRDDSQDENE